MMKIIKKPLSVLIGKTVGDFYYEIKEFIKSKYLINNFLISTFSTTPILTEDCRTTLYSVNIMDINEDISKLHDIPIFFSRNDWLEIAKIYIKRTGE